MAFFLYLGVPLATVLGWFNIYPKGKTKFPGTEASLAEGFEWVFKCGVVTFVVLLIAVVVGLLVWLLH